MFRFYCKRLLDLWANEKGTLNIRKKEKKIMQKQRYTGRYAVIATSLPPARETEKNGRKPAIALGRQVNRKE